MKKIFFISLVITQLSACSAEVGSEEWCNDLRDKDKEEWSTAEAKDYASHCLFK